MLSVYILSSVVYSERFDGFFLFCALILWVNIFELLSHGCAQASVIISGICIETAEMQSFSWDRGSESKIGATAYHLMFDL